MRYAAGADAEHDRPEHVRAASGLAWVGERLAVIQDDASFIALVDPGTGLADAFPLPPGPGGVRQFDDARGNKAGKLDLEALGVIPGGDGVHLIAFGSGSLAPRENVVFMKFTGDAPPIIDVRPAAAFYTMLRGSADFAGSEMNVEGVVHSTGVLRLFGRGNGAARGELRPVNASCDVPWPALRAYLERPDSAAPPVVVAVTQYDLGSLEGVPLGFTDAAPGRASIMLYAAAAEASPDATRDGQVQGSVVGIVDANEAAGRWARVTEEGGRAFTGKVEGLALDRGHPDRLFAAVDSDDHSRPSELLEICLSGPWWE